LALVAFSLFHIEGVRNLGFRGYFGKFFTLRGGIIGLFVGVLEFFLEFVKPVTLAMRLFGNIYAGEIALGVRGYLGKFFVFSGFKHGIASGFIDLFVGLIEFLLEFIKPVTLAMRLFGNIFGGEVALGVITALTIALIPAGMLLLEGLLNFVQALIFSTLMLMYTIIAVESHHTEEHPDVADVPEGGMAPPLSVGAASH
ncbi:MAG: F0F1 ATP synthase subunit A, partial [Actinomycetota bacterium]|nr:F0F1 ATP synthase subunit A [Actinomycetota bacterium]